MGTSDRPRGRGSRPTAGSGKTTLLGVLSGFIPDDERLITIEAVPGVTDGGGNRAKGNGNPAQCTNVDCASRLDLPRKDEAKSGFGQSAYRCWGWHATSYPNKEPGSHRGFFGTTRR